MEHTGTSVHWNKKEITEITEGFWSPLGHIGVHTMDFTEAKWSTKDDTGGNWSAVMCDGTAEMDGVNRKRY